MSAWYVQDVEKHWSWIKQLQMIEGCASGWPVTGQAHRLGRLGEQSEEGEIPGKEERYKDSPR